MKARLNTLIILPLAFLIAFVPIFCCCLTGQAQAQGQMASAAANNSHKCCDSQTKNNQPQHDSSQCDCANHLLSKATNIVPDNLGTFFAQNHSNLYQINVFALVLSSENPRYSSAYQVTHSPPFKSSSPFYIQYHTLRV